MTSARPALNPLPAVAFWRAEETWPLASPGYVFLGAALNRIGRALYPDGWSDGEFAAGAFVPHALPPWPPYGSPSADALREARNTLTVRDPAYRRPQVGPLSAPPVVSNAPPPLSLASWRAGQALPPRDKSPTPTTPAPVGDPPPSTGEAYAHAIALRQEWIAEAEASRARLLAVERRVSEAALAGALQVVWRSTVDGKLYATQPEWWGLDNRLPRFQTCRINWRTPAAAPTVADPWLFVRADDLDALLSGLVAPQAAWLPQKGDTLTFWARRDGPAEAAARVRLKAAGRSHPLEAHICDELAAMWNLTADARGVRPTSKQSVTQLRTRS